MNNEEITFFGETNFRNEQRRFGIKGRDRNKHIYVIGKTGMGKSTLLENMTIQDMQAGNGLAVVDPHGEYAEKMLDFVPKERIGDVIYLNPADLEWPIAFNIVEQVNTEHRHLVASGLMGVFKKMWPDVWSPRMEYILSNTILALLENPDSTLLGINRMLADKDYRKKVISNVQDPAVKSFWQTEFARYNERFQTEAIAPIQNKAGQFISAPIIRNIVGQVKSSINMREVMDTKKILILNLSKGKVGEDYSRLLGAMMITKLQLAAMSRVDIPIEQRSPFYLYVDEFQNFATESFAAILSEARKYGLSLILAHQYITQMDETVRDAVFGNVGTMATFRVGAADAEFLEKEFNPEFSANDLVNLSFKNIYLKLMIDGVASRPFSASTLAPLPTPLVSYKSEIIESSRKKYGQLKKEVEDSISKWYETPAIEETVSTIGKSDKEFNPPKLKKFKDEEGESLSSHFLHEASCWVCQKTTQLPFAPDNIRPVYCKSCIEKIKKGEIEPIAKKAGPIKTLPTLPPVSLKEVIKQQADREKKKGLKPEIKKERKEINLEDLRKTLGEALNKKESKKEVEENKEENGAPNKPEVKKGVIKLGETIKF